MINNSETNLHKPNDRLSILHDVILLNSTFKNIIADKLPYEWARKRKNLNQIIFAAGCHTILDIIENNPDSAAEKIADIISKIKQIENDILDKEYQRLEEACEDITVRLKSER